LRFQHAAFGPPKQSFDGVGSRYQHAHNAQRRQARCFIPRSISHGREQIFGRDGIGVIIPSSTTSDSGEFHASMHASDELACDYARDEIVQMKTYEA